MSAGRLHVRSPAGRKLGHLKNGTPDVLDETTILGASETTTAANPGTTRTTAAPETTDRPGTGTTGGGAVDPESGDGNVSPGSGDVISSVASPSTAVGSSASATSLANTRNSVISGTTSSPTSSNIGTVNTANGSSDGDGQPPYSAGNLPDPSPSATDVKAISDGNRTGPNRGSIAAAIICILLFVIGVVVFILRRRYKARRDEEKMKWWFTRKRLSQVYDDKEAFQSGSGNTSPRSSFGTSLDHADFPFHADVAIAPLPPMAEIGRPSGTAPALVLNLDTDRSRFSIGSANSHNSQFLVIRHRESLQPGNPSTPTEFFSFPKPPAVEATSLHSRHLEPEILYVASPTKRLSPSVAQVEFPIPNPFADDNPFDDPERSPSIALIEIEKVCRPFFPQLQDEMEVKIGDSVRVVQSFDDGWALVENTSKGEKGLVPLDCLRVPDESSSPGVRVSSHGAKAM